MADRDWRPNPGTHALLPRQKPEREVWVRYRNGYESPEKVRIEKRIWLDRGWDFDIKEWAP